MILIFLYLIYFLTFLSISDRDFFFQKRASTERMIVVKEPTVLDLSDQWRDVKKNS